MLKRAKHTHMLFLSELVNIIRSVNEAFYTNAITNIKSELQKASYKYNSTIKCVQLIMLIQYNIAKHMLTRQTQINADDAI
jgi:hypothetical protein